MQIGIAAYFRNVAVRCSRLANSCKDSDTKEGIEALARELTEKAEALERVFAIPQKQK
jgi:hypothetical protein